MRRVVVFPAVSGNQTPMIVPPRSTTGEIQPCRSRARRPIAPALGYPPCQPRRRALWGLRLATETQGILFFVIRAFRSFPCGPWLQGAGARAETPPPAPASPSSPLLHRGRHDVVRAIGERLRIA